MKHSLITLLFFLSINTLVAQTVYESPHVKDGKTIQFIIPEGYYEVMDMGLGNTMFASEEDIDPEENEFEEVEIGLIMMMHVVNDGETIESLKEDMESELENDGAMVISAPEIVEIKGKECLFAAFDGDFIDEGSSRAYFGIVQFGDYFVMVNYLSSKELKDHLEYNQFKGILSSYEIVATDKEDRMDEAMFDELDDYSIYFPNDLFETEISYYDILPDFTADWNDAIDESGHLLSRFTYKNENGSVKVFSGGTNANYPSEEEKARAIEQAMDWDQPMTLTYKSQFSNEDHFFKLYSISGGGTVTSVYTTIVNSELVFFVVDGGENPVDDFKPAVREFMLTMWVDYFDEEAEDANENPRY
jgi:hypothetical protein